VVACAETAESLGKTMTDLARLTSAPVVGALTKRDLVSQCEQIPATATPVIGVSATAGLGLAALLGAVTDAVLASTGTPDADTPMVTRARHRAALARARGELESFRAEWGAGALPAPVAAVRVRDAALALDELIGAIDVDDVLAQVFSTFCVGK
jgi:tRNA modification GTPase